MLKRIEDEIELLRRHLDVIRTVIAYQPIGIMKLSEILEMPPHRIRYSLRVLEQDGYIEASSSGAIATSTAIDLLEHLDERIDALVDVLESIKKADET